MCMDAGNFKLTAALWPSFSSFTETVVCLLAGTAALISRFSNMSSVRTADIYSATSWDCLMTRGFPQQLL